MSDKSQATVPLAHPAIADHFPGRPVVPAVLILEHILAAAPGTVTGIRNVKFLRVLTPNTPFRVSGEDRGTGRWRFNVCDEAGNELARGELEYTSA